MAWIESHQELANHPKTRRLARALSIPKAQAIGHLHLLWWWALDYAQDGNLAGFSPEDIADGAEWDGEIDVFYWGMVSAGFIDATDGDDDDLRCIHDWGDYGGNYIKRREQSRIRQQRYRDAHARDLPSNNEDVTRYETSGDASTGQDMTGQEITGEERTGENPEHDAAPARAKRVFPEEFETFWAPVIRKEPSKAKALEAWLKAQERTGAAPEEIYAGLLRWIPAHRATATEDITKVPHITTWLNQDRWTVERPAMPPRASPVMNGQGGGIIAHIESRQAARASPPQADEAIAADFRERH